LAGKQPQENLALTLESAFQNEVILKRMVLSESPTTEGRGIRLRRHQTNPKNPNNPDGRHRDFQESDFQKVDFQES
jgi:hypothetical protein